MLSAEHWLGARRGSRLDGNMNISIFRLLLIRLLASKVCDVHSMQLNELRKMSRIKVITQSFPVSCLFSFYKWHGHSKTCDRVRGVGPRENPRLGLIISCPLVNPCSRGKTVPETLLENTPMSAEQ